MVRRHSAENFLPSQNRRPAICTICTTMLRNIGRHLKSTHHVPPDTLRYKEVKLASHKRYNDYMLSKNITSAPQRKDQTEQSTSNDDRIQVDSAFHDLSFSSDEEDTVLIHRPAPNFSNDTHEGSLDPCEIDSTVSITTSHQPDIPTSTRECHVVLERIPDHVVSTGDTVHIVSQDSPSTAITRVSTPADEVTSQQVTSTRSLTRKRLRYKGLHTHHCMNHRLLQEFNSYLMRPDTKNMKSQDARAAAKSMSKFLYFVNTREVDFSQCTVKQNIINYIQLLQQVPVSASTIINRCDVLLHGIEFFIHHCGNTPVDSEHSLVLMIRRIKKNQREPLARRRAFLNSMLSRETLPPVWASRILGEKTAPIYDRLIQTCFSNGRLDKEELNWMTSILACHLALSNAHRQSAITTFTMDCYDKMRTVRQGNKILHQCVNSLHKNARKPAVISMDVGWQRRLQQYITHVRPQLTTSQDSLQPVFLTVNGKKLTNLSSAKRLYKVLALAGLSKFSFTDFRKSVSTFASGLDSVTSTALLDLLTHSEQTSKTYYRNATAPERMASAFLTIQGAPNT